MIARGIARAELRGDLDVELTVDLLWGAVFYRFLLAMVDGKAVEIDFIERVIADALSGLAVESS